MGITLRLSPFAVALFSAPLFAGLIKVWTIGQLATAPVLAVCRVEQVIPGADLPPGKAPWSTATRNMRAVLTVIRSLPVMKTTSITLNYYGYGSMVQGRMGGDAILPQLSSRDIRVLPLIQVAGEWRLAMEEGSNNVMPAIAPPRPEPPVKLPYDFLVGELVNSLSWGGYRDLQDTALYLRESQWAGIPATLIPLLRQNIAQNWERWADIAASSLAWYGIPRIPLAELRAMEPPPNLAALALRQLSSRDYPELIIRRMIEHSNLHEWGSAVTLQEYAKHPLVIQLMSTHLRAPAPGAVHIASVLIYTDPRSPLLPIALEAAFKTLNGSNANRSDRIAAPKLIVERGSEAQFNTLFEKFRTAQRNDTKIYREIFTAPYSPENPRATRIWGAMLEDRRLYSGPLRYCDVAVASMQSASKEKFGLTSYEQPLAERDRAVEKAARWMKAQPQ